jgi:hypothetical protein
MMCAKIFDSEMGGGMPSLSRRRDAGTVEETTEEDAQELLREINRMTDRLGAAALSR